MKKVRTTRSGIRITLLFFAAISASHLTADAQSGQTRAEVPADYLHVADFLRLQGMEDPAQGTYQEAVIAFHDIYELTMTEATIHGWVFPAAPDGEQKVLAWNGLTYDVIRTGGSADLKADVATQHMPMPERALVNECPELHSLFRIAGPVPGVLLALLGEGDLAQQVSRRDARIGYHRDIRVGAVTHFSTILVDATKSRFVVGEDQDALLCARSLRRFLNAMGKYPPMDGHIQSLTMSNDLSYLEKLIEDLNRRLGQKESERTSVADITKLPTEQQIPLLIDLLNEERKLYKNWRRDEPLKFASYALREVGEAAIDGLIASIDDERLTRTIRNSVMQSERLSFVTVGELCETRVTNYMQLWSYGKEDRSLDKQQIADLWAATRDMTKEERWLYALQDDGLPETVWRSVTDRLGSRSRVGKAAAPDSDPSIQIGPVVQWTELYKSSKDEVVSALLKRANGIPAQTANARRFSDFARGTPFALSAAAWDISAAKPTLMRIFQDEYARFQDKQVDLASIKRFAKLASALIYGGEDVWDQYESVLTRVDMNRSHIDLNALLLPIWQHPDNPNSVRIAEELFSGDSPWHARNTLDRDRDYTPTMMLYHPAFVKSVLETLNDTSTASKIILTKENWVEFELSGGRVVSTARDTGVLKNVGDSIDLRYCDRIMHELARIFNIGEYSTFLSLDEKDVHIAKVKEFFDAGADWSKLQDYQRPGLRERNQLFCTAQLWPEYDKPNSDDPKELHPWVDKALRVAENARRKKKP